MPQFLVRFSYTSRSIKKLIAEPTVDRASEASAMVASLGGQVLGYWYALGEFDGVVLIDAPESSTVAAVSMAIGGTGEAARVETTVLLTMDEAWRAVHGASTATHLPPGDDEVDR